MKRRLILRGASLLPFLTNFDNDNKEFQMNEQSAHKKVIKPKRLKVGDTLGVVALASSVSEKAIARATESLRGLGFKLKFGKNLNAQKGYLAGTDEQRLEDLHWAFSDPEVDAVWCIRGGYGVTRILPKVDFKLIKKNPKIFIGYSDITALHVAIHQKTGLVTFHGPVGTSDYTAFTKPNVLNVLTNPTPQYKLVHSEENLKKESNLFKPEVIKAGKCRGQLIGGNLSLLSALDGTPFALGNLKGKILFMEDIDERPYRIDRMLTQMLQSHDLTKLAGIALGVFEGCNPKPDENSLSLIECLKDRLGNLGIPVIYGLSFGHISNQYTLPVGIEAEMDTATGTLTLLETAVL
ncbi:MAG: LD-carboxypeptidase [Saprospiraceae bacterium]|nr:LD-carboxypeptidase [Saprospiraceae bacterium]